MAEDIKTKIKNYKIAPLTALAKPEPDQECWQKNYLNFHHCEKAVTTKVCVRVYPYHGSQPGMTATDRGLISWEDLAWLFPLLLCPPQIVKGDLGI